MFLHYFTGDLNQGIFKLSEVINDKLKSINLVVTALEHEEFKTNIRIQLDSGNPPDLFSYWAGARTNYLIEQEKIIPISDEFESTINPLDFDEVIINACSYKGKLYMLPLTRHFVGFFYNKEIFKKYNINVPTDWETLLVAAERVKQNGLIPFSLGAKNRWPAQLWFDYILLRTAGYNYREDLMNKAARYNDLEVLKTMDIWKHIIDEGYFNSNFKDYSWTDAVDELIEGKSAMTLMGTWLIPYMENHGLESDKDYGFFPFPEIDKEVENVSLGPIDGVLLSKGSKNKGSSLKVMQNIAQPEVQQAFNMLSGAIAPHNKVSTEIYSPMQMEIIDLIKKSSHWAFNYDIATEPYISEAGLDFFIDFLESPDQYERLLNELQIKINQK